jgi:hypothetical protein
VIILLKGEKLKELLMFDGSTCWEYEYEQEKEYGLDGPEWVSLNEAISHIESTRISELTNFDDIGRYFIGFNNENDDVIHFYRYEEDQWVIDIPIRRPELRPESFTLKMLGITTAQVVRIIEKFTIDPNFISTLLDYKSEFLGIGKRFCYHYEIDLKFLETLE